MATSDIDNIEYLPNDKQRDMFYIYVYDIHIWIDFEIGLFNFVVVS